MDYSKYLNDNSIEQWRKDLITNPSPGLLTRLKENDPAEFIQIVVNELICKTGYGPLCDSHKKAISETLMGHEVTAETRAKLAITGRARKGKFSAETRRKMSESSMGITHSDESKEKMRQAALGRKHSQETKDRLSKTLKGVPKSKAFRENLSKTVKGRVHVTNGVINKFVLVKDIPDGFTRGRTLKPKNK